MLLNPAACRRPVGRDPRRGVGRFERVPVSPVMFDVSATEASQPIPGGIAGRATTVEHPASLKAFRPCLRQAYSEVVTALDASVVSHAPSLWADCMTTASMTPTDG